MAAEAAAEAEGPFLGRDRDVSVNFCEFLCTKQKIQLKVVI